MNSIDPASLTPERRAELQREAMLFPAPALPGLGLRPFSDGIIALCGQLGLSIFTSEVSSVEKAEALGALELQRQYHTMLFLVGWRADEAEQKPVLTELLRLVREPEFYRDHVLPFVLLLPPDPERMARLFAEFGRYVVHQAAAAMKIIPRIPDDKRGEPPNA